jgi:CubicO group peptidase (beta-lactamase class C family)
VRGMNWRGASILTAVVAMSAGSLAAAGAEEAVQGEGPLAPAVIEASVSSLDEIIEEYMARTGVPGVAVAVVANDELVHARGFGVRDVTTGEPVNVDTVFQIASLSKPISATAIAGVVSDGIIGWDDPVRLANPTFELNDPWVSDRVTYADLLAMISGLPGLAGNYLESIGYDRSEILERLRLVELDPFRSSYSYSNHGFTAAGESAARAAGTSWEELEQKRLFEPAGMTSTSGRHDDFLAHEDRAALHVFLDGEWTPAFPRDPDPQSPAGCDSSTVTDLARWLRLLLRQGSLDDVEIIDPDALARITRPAIATGRPARPGGPWSSYGLGMNIGPTPNGAVRWNHSGAFSSGAATTALMVPDLDVGIVALTNGQPIGLSEAIADAYVDILETGSVSRDWLSIWSQRMAGVYGEPLDLSSLADRSAPARGHDAYVGTYANDFVGEVQVIEQDGGLVVLMGPIERPFPLTHLGADVFSYDHDPELPAFLSSASFMVGADGVASAVEVSTFDEIGWGLLERQ